MKIPANGFTHAGKFHADDVFATALLQILRPDIKITRGFVVPDEFDGIVYDIGFGMSTTIRSRGSTAPTVCLTRRSACCGGCWARGWWASGRPASLMRISSSRWT